MGHSVWVSGLELVLPSLDAEEEVNETLGKSNVSSKAKKIGIKRSFFCPTIKKTS